MIKKIYILIIFVVGFSALGAACSSISSVNDSDFEEEFVEDFEEEEIEDEPEFLPGEIQDSDRDESINRPLIGEVNFGDDEIVFDNDDSIDDAETVRLFNMAVKKFEFVPDLIKVKKDNKVVINIASEDVEHSFVLKGYDIYQIIPEGESVTIEFIADTIGEFNFYSDIYAGTGTSNMRGVLVVSP